MNDIPLLKGSTEGFRRFAIHLISLQKILGAAAAAPDPAQRLYALGARAPLFQLEGLARIYENLHNRHRFEKLRLTFKLLEDQLGRIDYYDGFRKEFSANPHCTPAVLEGLHSRMEQETQTLNTLLQTTGWLQQDGRRLKKTVSKLDGARYLSQEKEKKLFRCFWNNELARLQHEYHSGILNCHDIENGVHKIRRSLRWFSIYAQAMNGLVQLDQEPPLSHPEYASYLTREVVESPFNRMPAWNQSSKPLYVKAPVFYLLSALIAKLGVLKDNGLRIILLDELTKEHVSGAQTFEKMIILKRKDKSATLDTIKQEAKREIDECFFRFHLLRDLMIP